jgi:hypothetical protein
MKLNFYVALVISLLFTCYPDNANGQPQLDTLIKAFNRHRSSVVQEKLYIHFDRTVHLTGETLWFKVYVVDASFNKPFDLSKVAYLEIVDYNSFPILQTKVALQNGMGSGSLFIPASVTTGNYQVRAYTNWMKNFDPEFFFRQNITIVNTFIKPEAFAGKTTHQPVVSFFPEGGNLVHGLTSKVAFTIKDDTGHPLNCPGVIVNESNDTLARFNAERAGTGSFWITPSADQKLKGVVKDPQGKVSVHPLPDVYREGFVMHVADSLDFIKVKVRASYGKRVSPVYLFVHARQVVTHAEVNWMEENNTTFLIKKAALRQGISHFTLFNSNLQPVCERLFFSYPTAKLKIDINAERQQIGVRRKITLKLNTTLDQVPVATNMSIAVYKTDSIPSIPQQGLYNFLELTSDLGGAIESPEFYFSNHEYAKEGMDNLMLTHGWRRFKWENILQNNVNPSLAPEHRSHIIRAKVLTAEGQPAKNVYGYLSSPDKIIRLYTAQSNIHGELHFETNDLRDHSKIVIQTVGQPEQTYTIKLQDPFVTETIAAAIPLLNLPVVCRNDLLQRSIEMQVQDIFFPVARNNINTSHIDSLAFFGKADETYHLDDFTRFPVMEEVLREYVPGVLVRKRKDGFHFLVLDKVNKKVLPENPLILLDGIPVFNADEVMAFDPRKVKKLEVVTKKHYLGNLSFPGIISFTTYEGNLGGFPLNPKAITLNYESLQRQREFFAPQYEHQDQRLSSMPDQRNLLYWSPEVITDNSGRHTIEFYTSDVEGNYTVHVEGITKEGYAGSNSNYFSVKRFNN